METTMFLAQLWGPALLAVGVGLLLNRADYKKVYKGVSNEPLATLAFGLLAMTIGLAQILTHNIWNSTAAIVVSLLGWSAFLKGIVCIIAPGSTAAWAHRFEKVKPLGISGVFAVITGVYLIWIGFIA